MAIIDMQVTIEPKIKRSRTLGRLELQAELGEAMRHTNYSHLADRLLTCHRKYFRHKRCDRGHDWASAQDSCGLRICPHCSARRAQVLAGRFERLLDDKQDQRYAVFAERNVDQGCLDQGISSLWRSWARLRHSPQWKAKVRGCLAVLEVTYNQQENTWHPHLNVLMEGDYFPFEELNQAWVAATGGRGHTSFIGAADAGTIRELIKYVTKIADLVGNPDALGEFLGAIARRRLVRTYGTFYRIIKLDDEENPGEECPDCGSLVIVDLGCASHVTLDSKGVWRLHRSREDVDRAMAGAVSLHWVPSGDPEKSHEIKGAIDLFLEPSVAASVARDKWNRYLASEW